MKNIKNILSSIQFFLLTAVLLLFSTQFSWAVTSGDYSTLNGTSGTTLWSAVHTKAKSGYSTNISYATVWTVYATTDSYMSGSTKKIYDMYGGCDFTYSTDQCGNYSNECDCYNREHSIPKSWFGGSEAANTPGSDVFHLVPTDGKINNTRSNYAFGEVQTAKTTHNTNGMVNKLSTSGGGKSITIVNTMLGTSSTQSPGSSKQVFEPDDLYKGDFARGYFGTLLKWAGDYQAFTTGDGSVMFSGTYTEAGHWGLTPYGIALLLKWHRQDPVSQKEIDRNNGIENTQGNRNPFIDYPILAEYIWGKYAGNTFNTSNAVGSFESAFTPGVSDGDKVTGPTLSVSPTTLTMSATAGGSSTATFTITGANLTGSISITNTSGSGFSINPTSISAANANGTNTITVTYSPSAEGTHSATYSIASTGATSVTVTVNGTCAATRTVTWKVNNSAYTTGNPTTSVASGSKVTTLPTNPSVPSGCSGKTFVGWTATAITTETNTRPTDLFTTAAGSPTINANTTFHAVFATQSGSGGSSATVTFASGSDGSSDISSSISGQVSSASGMSSYSGTKVYAGSYGIKLGSSSATGSVTCNLSSSVSTSTITIDAKQYGSDTGTLSVKVNGNTSFGSAQRPSSSGGELTFSNGSAISVNSVTISTSSKRAYVKTITVGGGASYSGYITQCSAVTYVTLSFNANGGSGTMSDQSVPSGVETAINPCTFTRSGYTFAGWAESANGSVAYADGANITISSNKTLYAKWNELTSYTVTFKNIGTTYTTKSGYEGSTITGVSDPTPCDGYTFVGWSTHTYAATNTTSPTIDYTGTIPGANTTYHAVFSKTEGSGSGSGGASAGTTLWAEDFSGYSANDVPSGSTADSHTGTTVYNSGSVTYACENGAGTTKVYNENTAGGTAPEILIAKSGGAFSITGIPTGNATVMTLTFKTNKNYTDYCTVSSSTSNIVVGSQTISSGTSTCDITNSTGLTTFDLAITNGSSYNQNGREDNFLLVVKTAGSGSASTTYYTTSPNCAASTYTITWNATQNGGTCSTSTSTVTAGNAIGTLPTAIKDNYDFVGWFTAASGGTQITASTIPTGNVTYYAQFTIKTYSLTISATPTGYGSVSSTSIIGIPHGSAVTTNGNKFTVNGTTVTATPATATAQYTYAFSQWNNLPTTVTANVTNVQAVFTRTTNTYTVTFNANGHGTAPSAITGVEYNSTITAPTEPTATGWTFGGWYKESGCTNAWNFSSDKVTGNTILYAKWTAKPTYAVTFMDGTSTYDTKSGYEGQTIAVTDPTPCSGFTFVGWSTQQYSSDNTTTPSIDYNGTIPSGNTTYYAVYSIQGNPTTSLTNNYARITSLDDLTEGNYLVVGYYNSGYRAMQASTTGTYYLSSAVVTPSSNTISNPATNLIWYITVDGSSVTIFNSSAARFVYANRTTTRNYLNLTNGSTGISYTPSVSSGVWTFVSDRYTTYRIMYDGSNSRFGLATTATNSIYLYKQQEETTYTTYYTTDTSFTIIANPNNTTYGSTSITEL